MEKQINYSMRGKVPVLIFSILFLNLISISFVADVVDLVRSLSYGLSFKSELMTFIGTSTIVVIDLVASILFAIFMLKGQTKSKGSLSVACLLWIIRWAFYLITLIAAVYIEAEFLLGYRFWVSPILMITTFILMMITINQKFEGRAMFYATVAFSVIAWLYMLIDRAAPASGLYVFMMFIVFVCFFIYGVFNRIGKGRWGEYVSEQTDAEPFINDAPIYSEPVDHDNI